MRAKTLSLASIGAVLLWRIGTPSILVAQITGAPPQFEVASIRPNNVAVTFDDLRSGLGYPRARPGGRLEALNTSLGTLIRYAYGLRPEQTLEGDQRLLNQRVDVQAKAAEDLARVPEFTVGPLNLMLQDLLSQRFGLSVRWEEREQTVYQLVRARADGALGAQLRPSSPDCAAAKAAAEKAKFCGNPALQGLMRASGVTMSTFAQTLRVLLQDTPVFDRTALAGVYDLALTFDSSRLTQSPSNSQFDNSPSLFTALEEQLGLKLERSRAPIPVLIVEKIGPLVEN